MIFLSGLLLVSASLPLSASVDWGAMVPFHFLLFVISCSFSQHTRCLSLLFLLDAISYVLWRSFVPCCLHRVRIVSSSFILNHFLQTASQISLIPASRVRVAFSCATLEIVASAPHPCNRCDIEASAAKPKAVGKTNQTKEFKSIRLITHPSIWQHNNDNNDNNIRE